MLSPDSGLSLAPSAACWTAPEWLASRHAVLYYCAAPQLRLQRAKVLDRYCRTTAVMPGRCGALAAGSFSMLGCDQGPPTGRPARAPWLMSPGADTIQTSISSGTQVLPASTGGSSCLRGGSSHGPRESCKQADRGGRVIASVQLWAPSFRRRSLGAVGSWCRARSIFIRNG